MQPGEVLVTEHLCFRNQESFRGHNSMWQERDRASGKVPHIDVILMKPQWQGNWVLGPGPYSNKGPALSSLRVWLKPSPWCVTGAQWIIASETTWRATRKGLGVLSRCFILFGTKSDIFYSVNSVLNDFSCFAKIQFTFEGRRLVTIDKIQRVVL